MKRRNNPANTQSATNITNHLIRNIRRTLRGTKAKSFRKVGPTNVSSVQENHVRKIYTVVVEGLFSVVYNTILEFPILFPKHKRSLDFGTFNSF